MKKSLTRLLVAILFVFSISLLVTNATQAKPKLNKTTKVMIKGNKYTLKIKGVKNRNLKAVTFKTSKKSVVKVKKTSKKTAVITARKTGKATVKTVIRLKKKIKGKKKFTLKCRITVKNAERQDSNSKTDIDISEDKNTTSIDYSQNWENVMEQLNSAGFADITKINNFIIKDKIDGDYGFVTSSFWEDIDWYNEKEYKEIMAEIKRIVEITHISDEMSDEEKGYRLGRYLARNVEYYFSGHEQGIYGTLFNRKTVCAGYSKTYAVLCRFVGIDCDYITATYSGSGHAWNIVKLGNYWYSVDITDAYGLCNDISITYPFFREWDYVSETDRKYLDERFKTDEYRKIHPIDTMSYNMRCKQEGIPYLTGEELYKLPE